MLLKTPRGDSPSPSMVRLLEHEYAILQGLDLPGVMRVHEILRHDRGCCLVLEDPGGLPLQALLPWPQVDLDAFFKLAIQVATVLAELHQHAIIHKQLNPANILIPRLLRSGSPTSAWLQGRSAKHPGHFPCRSCLARWPTYHQSRPDA